VAITADGHLHEISATGKTVWTADISETAGSPTIFDNEVIVTSTTGTLAAIDEATGAQLWETESDATLSDGVAIDAPSDLLFLGAGNNTVMAVSATTGVPVWTWNVGSPIIGAPAVSGNTVYVATTGGSLVALNADLGSENWTYSAPGPLATSPAVTPAGIYVATAAGTAIGLSTKGTKAYAVVLGCTPIGLAAASGPLFATCGDGEVVAIQPWGEIVWDYHTNGSMTTPPAVVDSTVLVGNINDVYAFTPYGAPPD
jgi:outer membrane protein assembly factor BamB